MNRHRGENRLVSLVEKAKTECQSIAQAVRNDFETIGEAREACLTWNEIADGLGFVGKWREVQVAYSREKRRRAKKEKEVVPEKKKEAMPNAKAKTQKESTIFRSEDKAKGGRIGPPKPIGRGRFELGKDIPDDEL